MYYIYKEKKHKEPLALIGGIHMILVVDVGNTNMVFGIYDGEVLKGSFRLKTDAHRTSDEMGLLVSSYFGRFAIDPSLVEDVIIASVVPQVMHSLGNAMVKYFGRKPMVIDGDVDPALPYDVEKSDERLGPDRAVAALAAIHKYGAPLVVLDFGTATTVDAISREGAYLGGCITTGVRISADALYQKASMLPNIELAVPQKVIGTTAVAQIQAGVMLGYVGTVEYLIGRTKEEMGYPAEEIQVVATGGLAQEIATYSPMIDMVDSSLILEGLRMIYHREKQ